MRSFIKNMVAQLALLALSFIHKGLQGYFVGTSMAQLALSKKDCATCAKLVPLKNSLKALLLVNCATCATYAN